MKHRPRGKVLAVLYGCSEGIGLTYHLTDMAIAMSKKMALHPERETHICESR